MRGSFSVVCYAQGFSTDRQRSSNLFVARIQLTFRTPSFRTPIYSVCDRFPRFRPLSHPMIMMVRVTFFFTLYIISPHISDYEYSRQSMITGEGAQIALLCEYLAPLPHPVVILSIAPCADAESGADPNSPINVIFRNDAFPPKDEQHAISYATSLDTRRRSAGISPGSAVIPVNGLCGLSPSWEWTSRTLADEQLLILEGLGISNTTVPAVSLTVESAPPLLLPTLIDPKPFPRTSELDLTSFSAACLEHNTLFLSLPWANSPLGAIDEWTPHLRGMVQVMMASPFPVLLSYGPQCVLLYNEPYSKVIGKKHPEILSKKYDEAWPEVWGALEPVVRAGYQGQVLNVDCQEMFLLRGSKLEGEHPLLSV